MADEKDNESSTLMGRVKRYTGVTTGLTGVALRGAGRWLGGRELLGADNARALVGIGAAMVHLNAKLNWHRMFEDLIDGFDLRAVAQRRAEALEIAKFPPAGA